MTNFILAFFSAFGCDSTGKSLAADHVPSLAASLCQMSANTVDELTFTPSNLFYGANAKSTLPCIHENSDFDLVFQTRSLINDLCTILDGKTSKIVLNRGFTVDPIGDSLIKFYFSPLDIASSEKSEDLIKRLILCKPVEAHSREFELLFRLSSTNETGVIDERLHRCFIDVLLNRLELDSNLECFNKEFLNFIKTFVENHEPTTRNSSFYKNIAQQLYLLHFGSDGLDLFSSNIDTNGLAYAVCSELDLRTWSIDPETGMGFWSKFQSLDGEYNSRLIKFYLDGFPLGPSAYQDINYLNRLLSLERFSVGEPKNKQILNFKGPEIDPEFRRYTFVHKSVAAGMAFFAVCIFVSFFISPPRN